MCFENPNGTIRRFHVRQKIFFHPITGASIYKGLPDSFPLVPLPKLPKLRLEGSLDQGSNKMVFLRSSSSTAEISAALIAAYTSHGWIDLSSSPNYSRLCHDQLGQLFIQAAGQVSNENKINVIHSTSVANYEGVDGRDSCEDLLAYHQAGYGGGFRTYFYSLVPILEMPGNAVPPYSNLNPYIGVVEIRVWARA